MIVTYCNVPTTFQYRVESFNGVEYGGKREVAIGVEIGRVPSNLAR